MPLLMGGGRAGLAAAEMRPLIARRRGSTLSIPTRPVPQAVPKWLSD
jgi:hypothetical protein